MNSIYLPLRVIGLISLFISVDLFSSVIAAEFSGKPKVELGDDGRKITLIENFSFTDRQNYLWQVPKGAEVDGASIPQPFFSLIGGPLAGKYRNASIVHDFYCEPQNRIFDSDRVHEVFYHAMLTSGVSQAKAYVMYKAVQNFGPQWTEQQGRCTNHNVWQQASSADDPSVLNSLVDKCVQNNAVQIYDPNTIIDDEMAIEFLNSLKADKNIEVDLSSTVDEFVNLIRN